MDRDEADPPAPAGARGETVGSAAAAPLPVWTVPVRIAGAVGAVIGGLLLLTALVGDGAATDTGTLVLRAVGGSVLTILVAALAVLLARSVERSPPQGTQRTGPAEGWRAFLIGTAAWFLPAALAFGILALLGAPLSVTAPAGRFWGVLALLFLAVLLSEAVPEELVFRGYVTAVLAERLRGWWVVTAQTAAFTLTVLALRGGLGILDLSLFATMGFCLGYLRMVTGGVWTGVGFHCAFQTGAQLVLTHDIVGFGGSQPLAMLALGAVPFTAATLLVPALAAKRPDLFARAG
ncbi:CPBP family intramembrane glutamic endopeptidase [Nocardiopsis mangrovi]|uniref:CPBP family intramembrane glutamic endopeptidase n=1 Tax=Nocardiopsis mangrovi TaxID=1179818 RepID=A0ABV9E0Q5_9ACTN